MVVPGVVQDDHHAFCAGPSAQQQPQERFECFGVERVTQAVCEFPCLQAHCAKASNRLAGGCMGQHRVFDLWRNPHSAACAVLLEVAFVQAPQFKILSLCQTTQFF